MRSAVVTLTVCVAIVGLTPTSRIAADQHKPGGGGHAATGLKTPTIAAAADGRLWRAWVDGEHVFVGSSGDLGRTWSEGVRINPTSESIDANGESRPKIALGPTGEIYVSYTRYGKRPYTGDIRFARSIDGGRSFSEPRTVNDDGLEIGHRFDALVVGPDGIVYVIWIDKRDLERATEAKQPYAGAALYYTVSQDAGTSFAPNRKIKDHICECCRIAHAFDQRGRLVLVWRDVIDGRIRDHALVRLTADGLAGPVERITTDGWAIDACPHHGPGLAISADAMHIVWFTGEGPLGPGAFYGRFTPAAKLVGQPRRLGPSLPTTGHAVVHATGSRVLVAWKESRKEHGAAVMLMESTNSGATFSEPRQLAAAHGLADHPFLVAAGNRTLLSWYAPSKGHLVIPIQ